MNWIILGFIAAILTSICYIPQTIKAFKTKQTKDLSLLMLTILVFGLLFWLLYGIYRKDVVIILANVVAFVNICFLLFLKLKHG